MLRSWPFALVMVLLSGCATTLEPSAFFFRFGCDRQGALHAGVFSAESEKLLGVAEVGRCLGDMKIIGQAKGTGT